MAKYYDRNIIGWIKIDILAIIARQRYRKV